MNKYMIPAVVGAVLLVFAVTLSVVSNKSSNAAKLRTQKIVLKYKKLSDDALKMGDTTKALKFAKLAIGANPSGKIGYVCYTNAISAKYKTDSGNIGTTTQVVQPSASDDASVDLGC